MINKKPLTPTQVSSRNLKNIINDTRMPLSKYINKKATPTDKNMAYLDKFKQMFHVNHTTNQNTKQMRFSDNYMRTQMHTIINDTYMYDQTPKKVNHGHGHERAQSGLANPQVKTSNHKLRISQKKITGQQMINQIRNDLIKKRVISTSTYSTTMTKNKIKSQIVNYNNYLPIPNRNQVESNAQVCSKWGKMELKDILGSGANANVRQGYCHNTKFAVKIYQKYKLLQPKRRRRVYSQIQLLKSIPSHPNIIQIYESFQDKRQIHVIFEHLNQSITLHQYFRNNLLYLQQKQIQKIFNKIVRGVIHLHQYGIAHRDIKPDNILISFDEDQNMILKIIDFGFATIAHKADLHCGTPNFMAPQLLDKCIKYNPLSVDVWALGVTLFYLFQGRYPFKGYDQKDLYRAIKSCKYQFKKITSQPIMRIIEHTLVSDPSQRITVEELAKFQWVRNG